MTRNDCKTWLVLGHAGPPFPQATCPMQHRSEGRKPWFRVQRRSGIAFVCAGYLVGEGEKVLVSGYLVRDGGGVRVRYLTERGRVRWRK